jgi:hypothetical protein
LTVVDGEVRSLITTASFYCRHDRTWYTLHWTAGKGGTGRFHQDDESFRVSQRYMTMRGHLADDRTSARGTIEGHWDQGEYACSATVRFSARESGA